MRKKCHNLVLLTATRKWIYPLLSYNASHRKGAKQYLSHIMGFLQTVHFCMRPY